MPSGRLSPPRALAASAPLDSAPQAPGGAPARRAPRPPPPPQPLPGAGLCSHLPSPAPTSGGWPGPFPQPGAGGVALSHWGGIGRGEGCARLGVPCPGARHGGRCHGNAPSPAPRARTYIVRASSPPRPVPGGEARRARHPVAEGRVARAEAGRHPARRPLIPTRSFSRREGPGPPRLESGHGEASVSPLAGRKAAERHRFSKHPCQPGALSCKAFGKRSGSAAAPVCRGSAIPKVARVTVSRPSPEGSPRPAWPFTHPRGRWGRSLK